VDQAKDLVFHSTRSKGSTTILDWFLFVISLSLRQRFSISCLVFYYITHCPCFHRRHHHLFCVMTKMVSASEHERRALDNEDDVDAVLECSEPEDERRGGGGGVACILTSNEDVKCFLLYLMLYFFNYSRGFTCDVGIISLPSQCTCFF